MMIKAKLLFFITTIIFCFSLHASPQGHHQNTFVFGGSFGMGSFLKSDKVRESIGTLDELENAASFSLLLEVPLNRFLKLHSINLASGYRLEQIFTSGNGHYYVDRSNLPLTIEKKVDLTNHILKFSAGFDFDDTGYSQGGIEVGIGVSKYYCQVIISDDFDSTSDDSDVYKTSGFVMPLSLFFDWGAEGIGGRVSIQYQHAFYDKYKGITLHNSTTMVNIMLRYGFY